MIKIQPKSFFIHFQGGRPKGASLRRRQRLCRAYGQTYRFDRQIEALSVVSRLRSILDFLGSPFGRYKLQKKLIVGAMGVIVTLLSSCDRDKNNPGYDYFPDMAYSLAYETYAPNPNFADRKTLSAPVEGTVSREAENYPYKKNEADLLKAAKMKDPFDPDTVNLSRGKVVFQNVCLQCHGEKADGKGYLYTSGKYTYPPASLISQKAINRTD